MRYTNRVANGDQGLETLRLAAGIGRDDAFPPYEVGEAVTYVQGASLRGSLKVMATV